MKIKIQNLATQLKNLSYDEFDDVIRQLHPDDVLKAFLRVHDSDDQPKSDWVDTLLYVLDEVRTDPLRKLH